MSIQNVRAEAICDKCERGRIYVVQKLLDVRKRMRAEGWNVSTGKDFCPACFAQMEEKAKS